MTLPYFDWKRAIKGAFVGPAVFILAAEVWYGARLHFLMQLPWFPSALWVAAGCGAVIGGLMGDEASSLPEQFGDWMWKQFFGPSR